MDSSASPKQPRKKRRIGTPESKRSQVPPDMVPLVSPHLVQKSSKDPNRGMYPRSAEKSKNKKRSLTYPTFTKASKLLKDSHKGKSSDQMLDECDTSPESKSIEKSKNKKRSLTYPTFNKASKLLKDSYKVKNSDKVHDDCDTSSESKSAEKSKNKKRSLTYPTFNKASKLLKDSHKVKSSDQVLDECDSSSESTTDTPSPMTRRQQKFLQHRRRVAIMKPSSSCKKDLQKKQTSRKLGKFSSANFSNKISKYFIPLPRQEKASTSRNTDIDAQIVDAFSKKVDIDSSESVDEHFFEKLWKNYGLLEEECEEGERINYFDRLPIHVLESIFCQVPFLDLMRCRLVCSTWNDVISDDKFMTWKKRYYRLKKGRQDALTYMYDTCKSYDLSLVEDCFGVLIRYMSDEFCRKPSSDMCDLLLENSKALEAELVLAERFPEVLTKESKPWCIFTTAMLLSETVYDVYDIYSSVDKSNSDSSIPDVTDAMYCVAAFFLYFRNNYGINLGLHYRVYSALYWIENKLPSTEQNKPDVVKMTKKLPGQHSVHLYCAPSKPNLTYEQLRIINHHFQPKQVVKIIALAGTGKTTTLVHIARLYPQVNFINVMFNKSVSEAAKQKFPKNVVCRTAHSLAFTIFGNRLKSKLTTKIRPHDIVTELKHNEGSSLQIHSYAKHILTTIESFVASADESISENHVPLLDTNTRTISETDRAKILNDALQIWEKMIDKDYRNLRITHDVYLKLYQLSKPKLSGYQCIIVDEAQDCNPAMLDIMTSQNLPLILAGDPHQQIYAFRGANNALQSIEATHTYYLTKSFRFGPEISYIAACCLDVLKTGVTETIVGSDKHSSVDGRVEGKYAIISRTNVQLFNEAIRICCLKRRRSNEPTMIWGSFVGGLKSYGFEQMLDICKLACHEEGHAPKLADKFISKFQSFKDLANYARSVEDTELLCKIDLVTQHGMQIQSYIKTIKEICKYPVSQANVIFTTAHKAKGLEFDTVCLTDDYPVVPQFESRIRWRHSFNHRSTLSDEGFGPLSNEESNILYVALTRAISCLLLPDKLLRVLLTAQEKFEYPMPPSKVLKDRAHFKCINCGETFTPHTALILVRRKIVTASGRVIHGGELCMKCATEPTVRPRVQIEPVVMYLDPTADYAHRSMASLVGPLPTDPPIVRDTFGAFNEMDVVYIINVNI